MHAPVTHLFDLHEDGDNLANLAAKITLEKLIRERMKDYDQCAQVPLLCVVWNTLTRQSALQRLDKVLASRRILEPINHVESQFDNEFIDKFGQKHLYMILHILGASLLGHRAYICTCQHL